VVVPPGTAGGNFKISRSSFPIEHNMRPEEFHTAHPWFLFPPGEILNKMM
jgi:hypothetical protein